MQGMIKKSWIYVTFQKEGIHKYPAALTDPSLADVSFLGYPHRHMFGFKVQIEVYADDREIEFLQFKRFCMNLFDAGTLELNFKSCEMIARDMIEQINARYPDRDIIVEVNEDGENGGILEFSKG